MRANCRALASGLGSGDPVLRLAPDVQEIVHIAHSSESQHKHCGSRIEARRPTLCRTRLLKAVTAVGAQRRGQTDGFLPPWNSATKPFTLLYPE